METGQKTQNIKTNEEQYDFNFVVEVHDNPSDQNYSREILVDLDKAFAPQIAENQITWGWMVNP